MRTKQIKYFLLFSMSLLFCGCLRTYYPLYYSSSSLPLINETDNNLEMTSEYFSMDITYSDGRYEDEFSHTFRSSYVSSNTQPHTNFNYSLFGFGGSYKVSGVVGYDNKKYDGNKSAFGVGGDIKVGLNLKLSNLKVGIGSSCGLILEFGNYTTFRSEAYSKGTIESEHGWLFYSVSIFPYLVYEFSGDIALSTQLNLGSPGSISPVIALNNQGTLCWISLYPPNENGLKRVAMGVMMDMNKLFGPF